MANEPAFPCSTVKDTNPPHGIMAGAKFTGMTLRDYFAAKALTAAAPLHEPEQAAIWAYRYADAMLRERGRA